MSRILVADDDPFSVGALVTLLKGDGHDVRGVEHGGHAVEALAEGSFDAVLTDLDMPVADGGAVVRAARDCAPTACCGVITAMPGGTRDDLVAQGACFVADKPFDYDAVHGVLSECRSRGGRGPDGECPMAPALVQLGLRRP